MILGAMLFIGMYCIARETSLFGKKKGILPPIDWVRRPWDSFESVCTYFVTLAFLLTFVMTIIRIINENI